MGDLVVQGILGDRAFNRLVMLGEGAVDHAADGEQAPNAFGQHDEGADGRAGRRSERKVGHVSAHPFLAVPMQDLALGVPGVPHLVHRGAVVEDAAVGRPGPGPARRIAQAGVGVVAPGHLVARLGPGTGEDPAIARGRAVVAQLRERIQQLALAQDLLPGLVEHICQRVAVGFLGHFLGMGAVRIVIGRLVPGHVQHLFRAGAAFLLVEPPQLHHDAAEDGRIMPRFARWLLAGVVPLQPTAGVHDRPVFLGKAARRQPEDFGHDLFGLDVVEPAFVTPEV
ncbi:hypothetical protein D9M72_450900 [compost metagenome]